MNYKWENVNGNGANVHICLASIWTRVGWLLYRKETERRTAKRAREKQWGREGETGRMEWFQIVFHQADLMKVAYI